MKKFLIIAVAALLLVGVTAPAMAKMTVGGILFTDFYYMSRSHERMMGSIAPNALKTDTNNATTLIEVPNHSRFNVRWTNEHNVGMYLELQTATGGVALRHYYGWWDITPEWRIMVGHSTTPFAPLNPSQVMGFSNANGALHIIGIGFGNYYSGRFAQVRLQYKLPNNLGFFRVALVDPNNDGGVTGIPNPIPPNVPFPAPLAAAGYTADEDTTWPRIDVGMPLYFGPVKVYPSFFYHQRSWDDVVNGSDDDLTIWGASIGAVLSFGPVTVSGEYTWGENFGNSQGAFNLTTTLGAYNVARGYFDANLNTKFADTDCEGGWIQVAIKAGPATLNIMYGKQSAEDEAPVIAGIDYDVETQFYGISVPITCTKVFIVRPEIMYYDYGDSNKIAAATKVDNGNELLVGVQFMIMF